MKFCDLEEIFISDEDCQKCKQEQENCVDEDGKCMFEREINTDGEV